MPFREAKEEARPSREEAGSTTEPSEHSREPSPARSCKCECHGYGHDGHRPCNLETAPSRMGASARDLQLRRTLSRRDTALSRIRSRPAVPPFTHPLATQRTTQDVLVDFDGPDDPHRPMNWPTHKVNTTLLYGLATMTATWGSSAYASGTQQIAEEFNVGRQVATLGTTLFLLGFGVGPLLWAPLSEIYGRRVAALTPMFVAICFSFATATAKDLQTIMITRFFGAFFASAPVTNTGGVLGDLFSPMHRGIAMAGYALAVVGGPTAFVLLTAVVFIDETYPPKLLVAKASRLRHESGNWALHAKFEEWDVSVAELARKFLVRPVRLLCTPICFLVALYASFCYGILYMQLGAVPIIFHELRGWPFLSSELPFLALCLGSVTGAAVNVANQLYYNRAYHAAGNRPVPQKRLPPMMLESVLFAGGQFVTGWTADPRVVHRIAPVLGLYLSGCGFSTIFQAALNYLVDTFLRSCFAAAFPLVVTPLYHNLGVGPGQRI
ncbi:hypothetical protein DL764_009747 [Monosporascus ibericus]|uniref:Major facilitator superfamily (MFS) profile domain-containing protein n=1 Tax=Monosporascus ibericus TaxID=155417 RepID=A0A4Q4SX22_9PEZI|nr:hypothetical protein DL764_009747 [Monosporascus ibericus]